MRNYDNMQVKRAIFVIRCDAMVFLSCLLATHLHHQNGIVQASSYAYGEAVYEKGLKSTCANVGVGRGAWLGVRDPSSSSAATVILVS